MTSVQLTLLSDVMACMSAWYSLSLFFFFFFTFATFTVPDSLALFSFFIRLSCVFSVTSCFIKASNQQPHRKCQYILSFMAMSFLSPSSRYSGRSGGAGMWRKFLVQSRPLLFPLPNKDAHCNTEKWERKGVAEKRWRKRDSEKNHDLLWMWLPPLLPFLLCPSLPLSHACLTLDEVISMKVALPELGPRTLS